MDFELQEELQGLQDLANYEIPNEHDIPSLDARSVAHVLENAVEALAESSDAIADPQVFDAYRSMLKHAETLPGPLMSKMLDSITSGFQAQVEATNRDLDTEDQQTIAAHKKALEMYGFLLNWFVGAAEKVKGPGEEDGAAAPAPKARRGRGGKAGTSRPAARRNAEEWTWVDQIPPTLSLISKVLRLKTQRIWQTTGERDTFINCITRPAYHVTESEQYMKSIHIRTGVYKVICLAVKSHGHGLAAQISIMQSLQYYEHLSEPMADLLVVLAKEFDHAQLGDEILREIAAKSFSAQDSKGPRAFSRFLVRLAENTPRSVLKQISLLLGHLDSESYPMRMAIVEVIGCLIRELSATSEASNDDQQTRKQLEGLFELLIERVIDVSSYVRTKVLTVMTRLCDLQQKFPQQRLAMTRAAVDSLEDKGATVRKASVVLLVRLIETHPYGLMYGGELNQLEWEARYKEVCAQLQELEGVVGRAAEREGSQEEENEEQEEEEEVGERGKRMVSEAASLVSGECVCPPSLRKVYSFPQSSSKKIKSEDDDEMDVDEEEEGADQEEDRMDEDEDDEQPRPPKKKSKKKARKSEIDMVALTNEQEALAALEGDKILHLRLRKKYCSEGLTYIRQVEEGMQTVQKLLASTNKLEVLEAMDFFKTAHDYKFEGAEAGIKRMLHLIWSKDNSQTSDEGKELKGVRSRLLECYRQLYFDPVADLDPKGNINRITKNMIELTYGATLAELTSLEEMMRILMDDNQVHTDVINKLWQVYGSERPLPRPQRRGAVIILGMLALARRGVVADRVETLVKTGLGKLGMADLTLAKYTCVALQRLNGSAKKVKGSLLDKSLRLDMDNPLFRKLQDAIEHPTRSKDWFSMTEQAINTIYALGERPDVVCDTIIKNLTRRAFAAQARAKTPQPKDPDAMDEDESQETVNEGANASQADNSQANDSQSDESKDTGDAFVLSQLLFVVGHVAIKHIVYLELVEREWKRQKHEKELAEKAAKKGGAANAAKDQEELDQVAGNAEDEIGDRIAGIRESELLYGPESLLAIYGPMTVHICGSPHKFKNRTLRAAATLAFSKFLCISSKFCDEHHHLLFKILETSKDPNIRSNIVIALGDVAVSFNNIVDENSNELYKGLSDIDLVVKKNTLMVLTHLILNGMIKVKGQLGEMAKCLEDEDERIVDLAKLFFSELSTKDNAIYNNLPDVISHLSVGAHAVEEPSFQSTMRYIFTFIEKEKQAENIVEKLCQRFRLTEDPRQWRDIAFCLSLLPFKSERSVKKLIEGLQFYRDKLHEETVFARFQEILTKARANKSANKPDAELNEFESILEEHKRQGEEDQAFEKRVEGKKAAAKKRATRRTRKKATPKVEEDDE
ncbi:non-SMC mitotic condensation complex subunit 1-domain-containing protein [Fomitopsis serialis]|uniref:non-SMC mitotic condensation complex subunit 1-domain-containing protein n=1 Tax=Fomitopsis serialis TaxID=139415 RepID=UPI002007528A|nr:non-SMC mitotic condensation complex subunit 1-domain-containing protein [Neoantrodia serialis]KAH9924065.1 non-SMC mitotic condensation complex subunit 1-domain-containing protein [Neoantrodia serialis]